MSECSDNSEVFIVENILKYIAVWGGKPLWSNYEEEWQEFLFVSWVGYGNDDNCWISLDNVGKDGDGLFDGLPKPSFLRMMYDVREIFNQSSNENKLKEINNFRQAHRMRRIGFEKYKDDLKEISDFVSEPCPPWLKPHLLPYILGQKPIPGVSAEEQFPLFVSNSKRDAPSSPILSDPAASPNLHQNLLLAPPTISIEDPTTTPALDLSVEDLPSSPSVPSSPVLVKKDMKLNTDDTKRELSSSSSSSSSSSFSSSSSSFSQHSEDPNDFQVQSDSNLASSYFASSSVVNNNRPGTFLSIPKREPDMFLSASNNHAAASNKANNIINIDETTTQAPPKKNPAIRSLREQSMHEMRLLISSQLGETSSLNTVKAAPQSLQTIYSNQIVNQAVTQQQQQQHLSSRQNLAYPLMSTADKISVPTNQQITEVGVILHKPAVKVIEKMSRQDVRNVMKSKRKLVTDLQPMSVVNMAIQNKHKTKAKINNSINKSRKGLNPEVVLAPSEVDINVNNKTLDEVVSPPPSKRRKIKSTSKNHEDDMELDEDFAPTPDRYSRENLTPLITMSNHFNIFGLNSSHHSYNSVENFMNYNTNGMTNLTNQTTTITNSSTTTQNNYLHNNSVSSLTNQNSISFSSLDLSDITDGVLKKNPKQSKEDTNSDFKPVDQNTNKSNIHDNSISESTPSIPIVTLPEKTVVLSNEQHAGFSNDNNGLNNEEEVSPFSIPHSELDLLSFNYFKNNAASNSASLQQSENATVQKVDDTHEITATAIKPPLEDGIFSIRRTRERSVARRFHHYSLELNKSENRNVDIPSPPQLSNNVNESVSLASNTSIRGRRDRSVAVDPRYIVDFNEEARLNLQTNDKSIRGDSMNDRFDSSRSNDRQKHSRSHSLDLRNNNSNFNNNNNFKSYQKSSSYSRNLNDYKNSKKYNKYQSKNNSKSQKKQKFGKKSKNNKYNHDSDNSEDNPWGNIPSNAMGRDLKKAEQTLPSPILLQQQSASSSRQIVPLDRRRRDRSVSCSVSPTLIREIHSNIDRRRRDRSVSCSVAPSLVDNQISLPSRRLSNRRDRSLSVASKFNFDEIDENQMTKLKMHTTVDDDSDEDLHSLVPIGGCASPLPLERSKRDRSVSVSQMTQFSLDRPRNSRHSVLPVSPSHNTLTSFHNQPQTPTRAMFNYSRSPFANDHSMNRSTRDRSHQRSRSRHNAHPNQPRYHARSQPRDRSVAPSRPSSPLHMDPFERRTADMRMRERSRSKFAGDFVAEEEFLKARKEEEELKANRWTKERFGTRNYSSMRSSSRPRGDNKFFRSQSRPRSREDTSFNNNNSNSSVVNHVQNQNLHRQIPLAATDASPNTPQISSLFLYNLQQQAAQSANGSNYMQQFDTVSYACPNPLTPHVIPIRSELPLTTFKSPPLPHASLLQYLPAPPKTSEKHSMAKLLGYNCTPFTKTLADEEFTTENGVTQLANEEDGAEVPAISYNENLGFDGDYDTSLGPTPVSPISPFANPKEGEQNSSSRVGGRMRHLRSVSKSRGKESITSAQPVV